MLELAKCSSGYFNTNTPLQITPLEEKQFQKTNVCWLCEISCDKDKVRDHDHLTGKYRRTAHEVELNLQTNRFCSFFDNFSGCGCHQFF